MNVKRTQAERSEATRKALVSAARGLFAGRGYAGTSTEDLVREAGVTRGALYHHFKDKTEVFRAFTEEGVLELSRRIVEAADATGADPWERLHAGAQAFLDACLEPAVQRCLLEAPSVLGYETWREIRSRPAMHLLQGALETAMEAGAVVRQPVEPLAQMLFGAMHEAALAIARAENRDAARREVGETLTGLLSALRP